MLKDQRFLFLYLIAIFLTIVFYFLGVLERLDSFLRPLGYLSPFLLGFFYTTAFTTPFATGAYLLLNSGLNPLIGGILGGLGAMLTDLLIYNISKSEIGKTFRIGHHSYTIRKIRNRFILKISTILAIFIIASPLPDELAAVLLGLEKYNLRRFALISFLANSLGIFSLLYLGLTF